MLTADRPGLRPIDKFLAGCAIPASAWQDLVAARFGTFERAAEATIATEDWPICTTMGSVADGADCGQLDADFAEGKKALGAGYWNRAITALTLATLRDPQNVDLQNHVASAYRRLRHLEPAFVHYWQAVIMRGASGLWLRS